MSAFDDLKRTIRRAGAPATTALIAAMFALYVAAWLTKSLALSNGLAFTGRLSEPWTFLTYPFASTGGGLDFFWLLLLWWWFWMFGISVERDMGTPRYLTFFFGTTFIGSVSIFVASLILRTLPPLAGGLIPICAVTMAWCAVNQESQIQFLAIIPVTGKWLAVITAGIVLFYLGSVSPVMGVVGLIPLGAGWLVAKDSVPFFPYRGSVLAKRADKKRERLKSEEFDRQVKSRKQEREERERLRRLFENSIDDEK